MRLSHNLASLNAYNSYTKVLQRQSVALARISSGLKVQSAKDNPSVIAESEKINTQIRGLQMAGKNAQDGVSMLQTAEGGLDSMTASLQRIRDLTVQAGNGTNTESDRTQIQTEIDQMVKGLNDTAKNSEFNGVKLLSAGNSPADSTVTQLDMSVGANAGENIKIPLYNLTSSSLPKTGGNNIDSLITGGTLSIIDGTKAGAAIDVIDKAITAVISTRSKYGALENRFASTATNNGELSESMENANSQKIDADITTEMVEFSKDNILSEAGNAIMAQTNKMPQQILSILDNVRSR